MIYLVRHAHAGKRGEAPQDELRSLSEKGWREADALAALLDVPEGAAVLSSPSTRCIQTLEPLAARSGREIVSTDVLAEDSPVSPVLELLLEVPDGSVLCTHGVPLRPAVEAVLADGATLRGEPSWEKGVVWALERADGRITNAAVVSPCGPGLR